MQKLNDEIISLSMSLHRNRGIYALLIGSGLSSTAGIPTAWEIVNKLIAEIVVLKGEGTIADNLLQDWFRETFNVEPTYGELLSKISKHSSSERARAIRCYFEPTEQDLVEGKKVPTVAHRIIAKLVKLGYIKVIITTNFDSLLETAIRDEGISPVIISNASRLKGAEPLIHSACTIIKVNGDYLDLDTKNIPSELEKYDKKITKILDRIFDEFGLIVCGWSSDWDIALKRAIERCSNRRFTIYWTSHQGHLTEGAKRLLEFKACYEVLNITSADDFFNCLYQNLLSLEEIKQNHPINTKIAIATTKRFLVSPATRIQLHDLLMSEADNIYSALQGNDYDYMMPDYSEDQIWIRVEKYENILQIIQSIIIVACYWSNELHIDSIMKGIRRIGSQGQDKQKKYQSLMQIWQKLAIYPALFLIYSGGIAALANNKYDVVAALLTKIRIKMHPFENEKMIITVSAGYIFSPQRGFNMGSCVIKERLKKVLREPLRNYIADEHYEYYFCLFEFIYNLLFIHERIKSGETNCKFSFYSPFESLEIEGSAPENIRKEIEVLQNQHPLIQVGLFDGDFKKLLKIMNNIGIINKEPSVKT